MASMKKTDAIDQLGGTVATAARAVGVTYQAVNQWPAELPKRIVDRVQAALWRIHLQKHQPIQRSPKRKEVAHG